MKTIETNSLEIFKNNRYYPAEIGMVSDNAYLSIIATNKCQCRCAYCINSETDMRLSLPIEKGVNNIGKLVNKYKVKEAIILGGEPLLHPDIIGLVRELRLRSGLQMLRLTTNGIELKKHPEIIPALFNPETGIQGINISCHNEDFMSFADLSEVCHRIRNANPNIKIRINTNVWRGNLDTLQSLLGHIHTLSTFADEIRVSNIIEKDSFSVNDVNKGSHLVLSDNEYISLFSALIEHYSKEFSIFENKQTLGFVRYFLIPTKMPIIVNWNIGSTVAEQVCENDITNRQINTFKCLVNGEISLSWNNSNIIKL